MGRNPGLLCDYASTRDCTLLGAGMFGPTAKHMAHLLDWSVQKRMIVPQALSMPFYHPVIQEGLRPALRDLAAKLRVLGQCLPEDMGAAPGS